MKFYVYLLLFVFPFLVKGQIHNEDSYNFYINHQAEKAFFNKCKIKQEIKDSANCTINKHRLSIYKSAVQPYYGVKVFNPNLREFFNNDICNFIEHELFLQLFLNDLNKTEREKVIRIQLRNPLTNKIPTKKYILSLINSISSVKIDTKNKWSDISLISPNGILKIKFPIKFTLIYGKNKYQLQKELIEKIKNKKNGVVYFIIPEKLKKDREFYIYKGDSLFISEINSNLYFNHNKELLFDQRFDKESLANLLLTDMSNYKNIKTKLNFINYNSNETFFIKLNDFLSLFNKEYDKYFGIEEASGQNIKAVMFLVSKYFHFAHMLYIESDTKQLFSKNPELNIKVHSYIPFDNILSLINN